MHHAMVLIAIVCITDDFCIFVFWDPQRKMLVLMKERLPRQDVAKFEQIETYPDENQVSVGPGSVGNDHDGQEVEITIGHTERPR